MFTFAVVAMTIGTAVIGYMPTGRYFTHLPGFILILLFTTRCYAERGYVTVCLSVHPSVCNIEV